MNKICTIVLYAFFLVISAQSFAQTKDKGEFVKAKNEFWDEIRKTCDEFNAKDEPETLTFRIDFTTHKCPQKVEEFKAVWHNKPVSQAQTNTCWCFAGTSYLECELQRIHGKQIKLSEMHTVYYEYLEKAMRFVKERGNSAFGEGSQQNAVIRNWKKYGCVPYEVMTGLKPGQKFLDHSKLFAELNNYLQSVKSSNMWNEEAVISTFKAIMKDYIGVPPEKFEYEGKEYTPVSFMNEVVNLKLDDYVDLFSLMQKPYFQKCEYEVTDNWWHYSDYYNVPLDDDMNALKKAVKNGYSFSIGGDVTEPGYEGHAGVALVPTFDIPSQYIDENARQLRFSNKTTTDDHGIHVIGYKEMDGAFWFLVKDSGSGCRNNSHPGYYFYHEDYIKLKMMSATLHKSAVEDLLKKFN